MAQVVVLADPPREGLVLPDVPETSALSAADATRLYEAFLRDAVAAADASGGDTLVNYRPDDLLPERHRTETDAEDEVRSAVVAALADPEDVRFEPQVGSSRSARVGNTVTHLLEEEERSGVIVVDPRAPLLARTGVDEMAMKLRRSEVALAPSTRGRVAAMGFSEPIDFEDALAGRPLGRLTDRAGDAGLDVDFRSVEPLVETGPDAGSVLSLVAARVAAGRNRPEFTAALLEERGLPADAGVDPAGTDSS